MHLSSTDASASPKMLYVVVLVVAVFAAAIIDIVIPINTLDISQSFEVLPGTVGQLNSLVAIASVVTALLLAGFSTRFRYKTLVTIGLLFVALCSVGLIFAPSFWIVQLVVSLNGVGSVLVIVSALTYIGNSYPLDKKAKAIGWVTAANTLAIAVGAPIVGFMTSAGGWRSSLLWFMLPTAIISLVFVFLAFPHSFSQEPANVARTPFKTGVKHVLTNKSAVACLATSFFANAFMIGGSVFEVTLLRQVFSASPSFAALTGPLVSTVFISIGAILGGIIVNRIGRKRLTVIAVFVAGVFVLLSYSMSNMGVFLALRWAASFFFGVTITAVSNLVIEQVPKFRGAAMALSSATRGMGVAFGIAAAGAVLNLYVDTTIGFQMLGLTVAVFAFTSAFIALSFTKDPLRA